MLLLLLLLLLLGAVVVSLASLLQVVLVSASLGSCSVYTIPVWSCGCAVLERFGPFFGGGRGGGGVSGTMGEKHRLAPRGRGTSAAKSAARGNQNTAQPPR